jgi:hypothetical protein
VLTDMSSWRTSQCEIFSSKSKLRHMGRVDARWRYSQDENRVTEPGSWYRGHEKA